MNLQWVSVPQDRETSVAHIEMQSMTLRYAYARSADSIKNADVGQDYLTFVYSPARVAFVLCDGVSQSFYGDLAARLLGTHLLAELSVWEVNKETFAEQVQSLLAQLRETAEAATDSYQLEENAPAVLKNVLEKKRLLGSETTFVAGVADFGSNVLCLCWAGDSRLRIWNSKEEISNRLLPREEFKTKERWSTKKGLVGTLHFRAFDLREIWRLAVYSDGLSRLDGLAQRMPSDNGLNRMIEEARAEANSDDVSFFELLATNKPEVLKTIPPPTQLKLTRLPESLAVYWKTLANSTHTEVEVRTSTERRHWIVSGTDIDIPINSLPVSDSYNVRIRYWEQDEPGDWSSSLQVKGASSLLQEQMPLKPEEIPGTSATRRILDFSRLSLSGLTATVLLGILLGIIVGMLAYNLLHR